MARSVARAISAQASGHSPRHAVHAARRQLAVDGAQEASATSPAAPKGHCSATLWRKLPLGLKIANSVEDQTAFFHSLKAHSTEADARATASVIDKDD